MDGKKGQTAGTAVPDNTIKRQLAPSTLLSPVPVVMVTTGNMEKSNIVTVAWAGTVNSEPPMVSVSLRKSRYSHELLSASGKAVINLVSADLVKQTDICGVRSGRDTDKFKLTGLTKAASPLYGVPMIAESPVNLECSVTNVLELGSHDMFLLKIDAVHVAERLFDKDGRIQLEKADLVAYSHGEYYGLKGLLGFYGYSVAAKDVLNRRMKRRK